jgi:tripartite ATP-independent transporter DctM subunit
LDWYFILLIMIGLLLLFLISGMPVAFAFISLNFIAMYFWMGGIKAFIAVIPSAFQMLNNFVLVPVALFVIMGLIIFHSGAGLLIIDSLDRWMGRVPGRLSLLAVGAGTIFGAVSGVPMGTTAMLGSIFIPEMRKRGYSKEMSVGPILGGGGLALIIPPSGMIVVLGGLAKISIGQLLIACIIPGLVISCLYLLFIFFKAMRNPQSAPKYEGKRFSFLEKMASLRYIVPILGVIFMVTGVIFLGVATPTEAAATGALASFILVALYRKLSWTAIKKTLLSSVEVTIMVLMIIIGSVTFSQILAYTGSTRALAEFASGLTISPILVLIVMQLVIVALGCIMDLISITMITVPIFMPIVNALGFDPLWFSTMMIINLTAATISPPFGMLLFTIKGVVPPDITMGDIIRSAIPYFFIQLIGLGLVMAFKPLALWLPSMMKFF